MADHTKGQAVQVRTGPGRWVSAEVSGFTTRGHVKAIIDGRERHFPPDRVRVPATVVLRRPAEVPTSDEADSYERARERSAGQVPAPLRAVPKTKTQRSRSFLDFVRTKPCATCPNTEGWAVQAHHFTTGGMGLKGSDYYCAPQCMSCHGYDVREGNRRTYPDHTHGESMAMLWRSAAVLRDEYETQRETRR